MELVQHPVQVDEENIWISDMTDVVEAYWLGRAIEREQWENKRTVHVVPLIENNPDFTLELYADPVVLSHELLNQLREKLEEYDEKHSR